MRPENLIKKIQTFRNVINYRHALRESITFLKEKPLGEHLICNLHHTLMASVRGKEKSPGNFRKMPVHIGKPGSPAKDTVYVPPLPTDITNLMKNWVKFVHKDDIDPLIQAGLAHYQFEAIDPFMDGNGRMGRMLIPIMLYKKGIIPYPYLYISEYLERHRSEYYEALRGIDQNRDWDRWIHLFLDAVKETSEQMHDKVSKMYELYGRLKEDLVKFNSQYATLLLDLLFERPITSSREIIKQLNQPSTQTVYNLIEKFETRGIIYESTGNKRNKEYVFAELLDIIQ